MKQRFTASLTPSPDTLRLYIESALGYVESALAGSDHDGFSLKSAQGDLKEVLDYLQHFDAANEVMIFRGLRIEGRIGEKQVVDDFQLTDVADDIIAEAARRGTLKPRTHQEDVALP